MKTSTVTPKDVLKFTSATSAFLCPIDANIYGIKFGKFTLRDADTNKVLYSVSPIEGAPLVVGDASRLIRYKFPKDFLTLKTISTAVEFKVGPKEVKNFRMIERHYYKSKLIRSYDFTFGFCIPNSANTWELIYSMPEFTEDEITEMAKHPFETKSDSFYFVENQLFMHHKAEYAYVNSHY